MCHNKSGSQVIQHEKGRGIVYLVVYISVRAFATSSPDPLYDPKWKRVKDNRAAYNYDLIFNAIG